MSARIKIIDLLELEAMHTGSLMSRRRALLSCEFSYELSDKGAEHRAEAGYIKFKQDEDWKQAYSELKSVLDEREHWPSKSERTEQRQKRQKR